MYSVNHALVIGVSLSLLTSAISAADAQSELWEKEYEIAVAKSAGPEAVSTDASIWVLTADGYESAVEGTNGFNCLVMRRWGAGFDVQKALFETPGSVIAPICYDPKASGAPMQEQFLRAELGLQGKSHDEIKSAVLDAYEAEELKALDGVAFAYMYSAAQKLGPNVGAWHPHVMVYAPGYTNDMLGGLAINSGDPVIAEAPGTVRAIIAIPVDGRRTHIDPAH